MGRPSSGGGARGRHRNEGCTIKCQMGGTVGAHGVNRGGGMVPHGYATAFNYFTLIDLFYFYPLSIMIMIVIILIVLIF